MPRIKPTSEVVVLNVSMIAGIPPATLLCGPRSGPVFSSGGNADGSVLSGIEVLKDSYKRSGGNANQTGWQYGDEVSTTAR